MKSISWEIILTGFLFVGLSIFLIENDSGSDKTGTNVIEDDSVTVKIDENTLKSFELESLKNLEDLKSLKNLENTKTLESLKSLKTFLPLEIQAEFEKEIDSVIKAFDQESVRVQFDTSKRTLTIDPSAIQGPGWSAKTPGVFQYSTTFKSDELEKIDLILPFGSIDISGADTETGHLVMEASGNISSLDDLKSKLSTKSKIKNKIATFEVNTENERKAGQNIQLQSDLKVAREVQLDILTMAGHIISKHITGQQHYKTNGGHVTLSLLSGEIHATTGGGHIDIKDSDGIIDLNSKGGNIRVQNVEGSIDLQSGGGSLQIIDHIGKINASTRGGNIDLRIPDLKNSINARTGAGTITIWLSPDTNAKLNLSGSSIEIDPIFNFKGRIHSGKATGAIGSGTQDITAFTNYGTVVLKAIE